MTKTNAERQKAYRANRPTSNNGEGERRLNTWLSTKASLALARLASHHNTSQRAVLELLLLKADEAIMSVMDIDSPEWQAYFDKERLRSNEHDKVSAFNDILEAK